MRHQYKIIKTSVFLLLLLSFMVIKAQQKPVEDYTERLNNAVSSSDHTNPNYKYLDTFITKFQKAGKLEATMLSKDAVGIAIFLPNDSKSLDIYPARYTVDKDKVDISALRNRNTQKPNEDMKEYVDFYLTDWKKLGTSKTFKSLMLNHPVPQSTITEMTNGHMVDSGYATSFLRGDEHWLYAVSFGDSGIIIYAFRME
ncbi:hypothetical protein EZJ43_08035 [Pedobacter changchengzhani]|uniref:Uncharacterized protein n=1 Tax=Pedobacter changchengzhani TaxID=2529274 RepID=A0A4R5MLF1_9SPHI|nr:hypothetical protein [Pedobacter changchengzhani]TDG36458.1 hypothetical protein EZJ43_08035 [Pedobacter changchengzhani]